MTNINCDVIQDLITLRQEELCSEASSRLIEEHLQGCESCRSYARRIRMPVDIPLAQEPIEQAAEKKLVKRSLRKVKHRYMLSVISVLVVLCLLAGAGYLGYHEKTGNGVAFSNLDDIFCSARYMNYLKSGEYRKAAAMMDWGDSYDSIEESRQAIYESPFSHLTAVTAFGTEFAAGYPLSDSLCSDRETNRLTTAEEGWQIYKKDVSKELRAAIYNGVIAMLVPQTLWLEAVGSDYTVTEDEQGRLCYRLRLSPENTGYNTWFYPLTNSYGRFIYSSNGQLPEQEPILKDSADAYTLYRSCICLLPIEILEDAKAQILEAQQQDINQWEAYYSQAMSLSREEYITECRERFAQAMEDYSAGHRLTINGIQNITAVEIDGQADWCIEYSVRETGKDGTVTDYVIRCIRVKENMSISIYPDLQKLLQQTGLYHPEDSPEIDSAISRPDSLYRIFTYLHMLDGADALFENSGI